MTIKQEHSNRVEAEHYSTFESIFFVNENARAVRVPDYQRAFSWEKKQIKLFVEDLQQQQGKGYYFGHFIVEDDNGEWAVVDGQQRITTFVLFLMVCRCYSEGHFAYTLINQFQTVSYDAEALVSVSENLESFLETYGDCDEKTVLSDDQIFKGLKLEKPLTRSQRLMVLALLRFNRAFNKEELDAGQIGDYIDMVMGAHCSHHVAPDKAVAVNIFELHNTRGVPLTTLEIVKAKLMKFVYDHAVTEREDRVSEIQAEFGEIYAMEERLAESSFRGKMSIERLFSLHLRAVDDDGEQRDFEHPGVNPGMDGLVKYVERRLRFKEGAEKKGALPTEEGVRYALNMAKEFKKSVRIVSEHLPAWDKEAPLVGDILILDPNLSCQFLLLVSRRFESATDAADGRVESELLRLWERLVFTRDFHWKYHNLPKGRRDNFPAVFACCASKDEDIEKTLTGYLENGFRDWDRTRGLQSIVVGLLDDHKDQFLNNAFNWWKHKVIYALYKYEVRDNPKIRDVMKGKISVEHIIPQSWDRKWLNGYEQMDSEQRDARIKEVGSFINGLGNLALLTPSENSSASDAKPAEKHYKGYTGAGFYLYHDEHRTEWDDSNNWKGLVQDRGEKIFEFMRNTLIGADDAAGDG